ncbi:hypothetical protein J3459_006276 [Metarhizium acridum]|nr:hypothetical protein J3459_006276 [Metarhizium acridum]
MYTRGGTMYWVSAQQRSNTKYDSVLNRDNLALGAIERINIAHRTLGQPELIQEEIKEDKQLGDEYISEYWNSSIRYGGFWTSDQVKDEPDFIEGGQANGFGFTQSTFHKLHRLVNLRMMLAGHITGNGDKMTRDMNVHAMHCLEYVRGRELMNPGLNEEPTDTVDYKSMGIH